MENKETDLRSLKEIELDLLSQPEIVEMDEIMGNGKEKFSDKPAEGQTSAGNTEKETRLNPDLEVITKKDPDEIIILPNEDLKKMNNRKNKNQPF